MCIGIDISSISSTVFLLFKSYGLHSDEKKCIQAIILWWQFWILFLVQFQENVRNDDVSNIKANGIAIQMNNIFYEILNSLFMSQMGFEFNYVWH